MELQRLINILVPVALFEMMVAIGLGVTLREVAAVARDWRLLTRAALANYLLVPAATVGLLLLFHADPMVSAGFLILAACPGAPFGPPVTAIAKGSVTASVGLMILLAGSSAVLAPLLLGLLLPLLGGGVQVRIEPHKLLITLLVTQFVPLCLGLLVRQRRPGLARRIQKPANRLGALLNLLTIMLILVAQYHTLAVIRWRGLSGMAVLLTTSLVIGWILGPSPAENRKAMMLTTSLRNVGVGLVIANGTFAGTPAVTAVIAYALVEVFGSLLVAAGCRFSPKEQPALAGV